MSKYAKRVDSNHAEIKRAFEKLGCVVFDSYAVGQGFPDLVVQWGGVTMLVEIKTEKGKLTESQTASPLMSRLVRNMDDVADTVSVLRKWHTSIARAAGR